MSNVILFILASIGLTNIIVDGSIFQSVRDWLKIKLHPSLYKLFECYQCAGLWCGLFTGAVLINHTNVFVIFCCGLASSFLANFGAIYFNYLEAISVIELPAQDQNASPEV